MPHRVRVYRGRRVRPNPFLSVLLLRLPLDRTAQLSSAQLSSAQRVCVSAGAYTVRCECPTWVLRVPQGIWRGHLLRLVHADAKYNNPDPDSG